MIEFIVGVVWTYLCLSLGVGTEVYIHERVQNDMSRTSARKSAVKRMLNWPYRLFRYAK